MSLLNPTTEDTPFYKTTWFTVVLLFLLTPVGLVLMWKSDDWENRTKLIVTGVAVALIATKILTML